MIVGREVKDLYVRAPLARGRETLHVRRSRDGQRRARLLRRLCAARCWASSACAARARKRSAARCSAPSRMHGAVTLDGKALDLVIAAARACEPGVGLIARDRVGGERRAGALSVRENMFLNPCAIGRSLMSLLSPAARGRARPSPSARDVGPAPQRSRRCRSRRCRAATSRRWWSAAGCATGRSCWSPRIRRPASTSAPRRRSTGCIARALDARPRRHRRLHRFRGSRPHLPPRAGVLARHDRRRNRQARRSPPKPLIQRPRHPQPRGTDLTCNSIKSNALEPTRSELQGLSLGQKLGRLVPVYGLRHPHRGADPAVLDPAADDLPDAAEPALDHLRQGHHRAAVAGRDDPDGGGPHRPDRRLRHRALAHPRHLRCRPCTAFPGRWRCSSCCCSAR